MSALPFIVPKADISLDALIAAAVNAQESSPSLLLVHTSSSKPSEPTLGSLDVEAAFKFAESKVGRRWIHRLVAAARPRVAAGSVGQFDEAVDRLRNRWEQPDVREIERLVYDARVEHGCVVRAVEEVRAEIGARNAHGRRDALDRLAALVAERWPKAERAPARMSPQSYHDAHSLLFDVTAPRIKGRQKTLDELSATAERARAVAAKRQAERRARGKG